MPATIVHPRIPAFINGYPVISAHENTHRGGVTVTVQREADAPHPWVVWTAYQHQRGVWTAEHDDYCTAHTDALSAFVERAKLNPLGD